VLRLPDFALDCSIYLYASVDDAQAGKSGGGSGFLIGVPAMQIEGEGMSAIEKSFANGCFYIYAITNRHVVEHGASVVRMSTIAGGVDIIDCRPLDWVTHPSQDLAAIEITLDTLRHPAHFITTEMLLSEKLMRDFNVGPGDETFLIGRFVYADGGVKNHPSVRFGSISMNPGQPIRQEGGHQQDGFLVECHSIGGYSGSPVFVSLLTTPREIKPSRAKGHLPMYLLGVDWGHLPTKWIPITDRAGNLHGEGWGIKQNSGMMGVVPAWHIMELLNLPALKDKRKEADDKLREEQAGAGVLDSDTGDEQTFSQADFEAALRKVSRKIKPEK
jgi:hypothetical protein